MQILFNFLLFSIIYVSSNESDSETEAVDPNAVPVDTWDQINDSEDLKDILMAKNTCYIYSKAATYAIYNGLKLADNFNTFGDYRDMVLMEDVEDEKN